MVNERKIVWSDDAKKQLRQAYKYIEQDSLQNAINVRNDILALIKQIPVYPEKFSPDKFKINNDGTYRNFEKHRYRIAFRVLANEVRILRVRHTSMEPLLY